MIVSEAVPGNPCGGPSNQLCTHHVDGDFADFDVAEVLTELLDALLLLGDLLGQHRPQVRAGTSAREGRDGRQFLEGIKDGSWLDIVRYDSLDQLYTWLFSTTKKYVQ